MTAHPIDTEESRPMADHPFTPHADSIQTAWVLMCQQSRIATQPPVEELEAEFDRFLARVKRDALAAAEHRATRAEAQSAIRGRAVAIYQRRAREAEAEARTQRHRADDMEDNALRTQGNLRAMKERLETAEARIQAVRDVLDSIDPRDTDGGITAATIENDIDWQAAPQYVANDLARNGIRVVTEGEQ